MFAAQRLKGIGDVVISVKQAVDVLADWICLRNRVERIRDITGSPAACREGFRGCNWQKGKAGSRGGG